MNAKTCKRLRRQAEAETVGAPARVLVKSKHVLSPAGTSIAVNGPSSTRGRYRNLKRDEHKRGPGLHQRTLA